VSNVTWVANFQAIQYSITYTLNGGSGTMTPTTYTVETPTITLPIPTQGGHDFKGWFDNASFTGSAITTIPAGSTGNKTFYAKWEAVSTTVPVTGLTVTPTTATLTVGQTQQLTPQVAPSNATNKTVTWTSNNPSVASVNASTGLVSALAPGTATITGTTADGGKTATSTITVNAANYTINATNDMYSTITPSGNVSVPNGGNQTFTWTFVPGYELHDLIVNGTPMSWATSSYTFTNVTSNRSISVSSRAKTYAVKFNVNGGQALPNGSFTIESPLYTLPVPVRTGYTFLGWFSNAGLTGTAVISIPGGSTGDREFWAKWEVTTTVIPVSGVTLDRTALSMKVGDEVTLIATVNPSNASNKALTWTVTGTAVTVDANGKVTAKTAGTSTVTATSDNGKTASCTVTVTAATKYRLTVVDGKTGAGTASGDYLPGEVVTIVANTPPTNKLFDRWNATGGQLANPYAPTTTITMPSGAVTVTALYKDDPTGIENIDAPSWNAYGANGILTVETHNLPVRGISVYNVSGLLLASDRSGHDRVLFTGLPKGIYIVRILTQEGLRTKKVALSH